MNRDDYQLLVRDLEHELLSGGGPVGVIGLTHIALQLLASLAPSGLLGAIEAIYTSDPTQIGSFLSVPVRTISDLSNSNLTVIVIAADEEKEDLLQSALPYMNGAPKIIVSGYGHLQFRDPVFLEVLSRLYVPSFANGYPNSLIHIYQCLKNAARLGLQGTVAEFGMFKGGTTMFMSQIIERSGFDWPVIGFDSFSGFPERKSPLDMYNHPGCIFSDLPVIRRYFEGRNVEIVPGEITETCHRLADENLVLTFIDTDNYTPASHALKIVRDRTVVGGAIVFDHFAGTDRFRYTLGERMAASVLLDDIRYFHLHDTGVFFRQR